MKSSIVVLITLLLNSCGHLKDCTNLKDEELKSCKAYNKRIRGIYSNTMSSDGSASAATNAGNGAVKQIMHHTPPPSPPPF